MPTSDVNAPRREPAELFVSRERREELIRELPFLPSWSLTQRQICDLELLAVGGFAPLSGFLGRAAFESVCRELRLPDGRLWPIPVTLEISDELAATLAPGTSRLVLRDPEGLPLAVVGVDEIYEPDRELEARSVYGTLDASHPGVAALSRPGQRFAVGGDVEVLRLPPHADFTALRLTPHALRAEFERLGWTRIVAFQTRNPMHRAHFELTRRAALDVGGNLLIHPVVGMTKSGDIDHFTRVRCYQHLLPHYPHGSTMLALLPLAMRMAGPREAMLHAIVRKNYGCTHMIVGRDHAGPGAAADGRPFYGPYDAQELVRRHQQEIGLEMVPFSEMLYLPDEDRYLTDDEARQEGSKERTRTISGTSLRRLLERDDEIPSWFTFPEVAAELRRRHPPRARQGFTVFFTGLSGAGKSTVARALEMRLLEIGGRPVTLLDGDIVRRHLSSELGFSKEHRDLNIRRIGFVASEITKNGGIAICAPIAPYDALRREVRGAIEPHGGFIEVWVATPLAACEARDVKGLYAKARAGLLPAFTGISDPYEEPGDAELVFDGSATEVAEAVEQIVGCLEQLGFLPPAAEVDQLGPSRKLALTEKMSSAGASNVSKSSLAPSGSPTSSSDTRF